MHVCEVGEPETNLVLLEACCRAYLGCLWGLHGQIPLDTQGILHKAVDPAVEALGVLDLGSQQKPNQRLAHIFTLLSGIYLGKAVESHDEEATS